LLSDSWAPSFWAWVGLKAAAPPPPLLNWSGRKEEIP